MWTKTNTEQQLIEGVLRHGPNILEHCETSDELTQYLNRINQERLNYPIPPKTVDVTHWFIPNEYCPNLVEYLYGCCTTDAQRDRVSLELELFIKNGMYDVLHVMKYIVDTLRENNIVWGVGRGSSVASYVLYLIGVHKVDSIKYNLPIEEFFKGEQNG
jgi:DNA polymerase III alpha subunit